MTKEKLIIVALVIFSFLLVFVVESPAKVGSINAVSSYSLALSYSTSTLSPSTAKSLVPRATSSRTKAEVCVVSGGPAWLYQQGTSTGAIAGRGTPVSSSTGYDVCKQFDIADPYTGEVWGVSDTTTTVSINLLQS